MNQMKWVFLIGLIWAVVCIYFVAKGGKHLNKPHQKFEKIPIIVGLSVAGIIGLLAIIGLIFFD